MLPRVMITLPKFFAYKKKKKKCTIGGPAHIQTIVKFLPHSCQHNGGVTGYGSCNFFQLRRHFTSVDLSRDTT